MTTDRKLARVLATLRAVAADLRVLAEQDPDAQARQVFAQESSRAERMAERLARRLEEVRRQEPEYARFPAAPGGENP